MEQDGNSGGEEEIKMRMSTCVPGLARSREIESLNTTKTLINDLRSQSKENIR